LQKGVERGEDEDRDNNNNQGASNWKMKKAERFQ